METNLSNQLVITLPSDTEIQMTRVFNAPKRAVFEAWTKPEILRQWFGPRGWSLSTCEVDLRPGGAWRFVGEGPNGETMGMSGVYQEVSPYDRLVSTEIFDDYAEFGAAINTATFVEENGQTTWTNIVTYPSKETRDAVIASGMESGAGETLDRLAEVIE